MRYPTLFNLTARNGTKEMGMSDVKKVLERAAEIVERGWRQGANARDDDDWPVPAYSKAARSWSAYGAISSVVGRYADALAAEIAVEAVVNCNIRPWNNHPDRTQSEVVTALRDAAGRVRE